MLAKIISFLTPMAAKYGLYALAVLAAGSGFLYFEHLRATVAADAVTISEVKDVNKQNSATIADLQEKAKRYDAIEAATAQADLTRQADTAAKHATINAMAAAPISASSAATLNLLRGTP
jgi:hypothetical protein